MAERDDLRGKVGGGWGAEWVVVGSKESGGRRRPLPLALPLLCGLLAAQTLVWVGLLTSVCWPAPLSLFPVPCLLLLLRAGLQLDKASRSGAGGSRSSSVGGIGSLLPLLVVAVLAFLVGHFMQQGVPVLQRVVAGGDDE